MDKIIDDHWDYVESVLIYHGVNYKDIKYAEEKYKWGFKDGLNGNPIYSGCFHYETAHKHGLKHKGN